MTDTKVAKRGRPPKLVLNDAMEKILERVSQGETLRAICRERNMPSEHTFRKWIRDNAELQRLWMMAKELRAHALFDEAIDLARVLSKDNGINITSQQANALRVSIDTLKFAAARLNPRDYGERVPTNPIVPIQIVTNLNLGQDGPAKRGEGDDIFEVRLVQPITVDGALPDKRSNSRD